MATTNNNVSYGICNFGYGIVTVGTDGALTFGTPTLVKNAQSFSKTRNVNSTKVYADNKEIFECSSETSETLTFVFSSLPDEVKEAILNHAADSKGHDVEVTNSATKYFYCFYEMRGDVLARREVFLKCTAVLGNEQTSSTGDNITVNSETLTVTAYPVEDGTHDVISYAVDSSDTDYAAVLTAAPTLPTFTA